MLRTFSVLAGLVGVAAILSAQAIDPDTFKVSYFANNLETDSNTVRVTNVGTSGGNICADICVFDPNQESAAVSGGACSLPTAPKPVSGVSAWATHLQNNNTYTETEFLDSGLSATELGRLGAQCKAIQLAGSGKGVCTCHPEDVG
jgi:hypothetical protein